MWYVLMVIGLFVVIVWPIIKFFKGLLSKKNKEIQKFVPDKKMYMLIDFASLMNKHIENNLQLSSPLIFFEQVFLLYFLSDMNAIGKKVTESDRHSKLNNLIISLEVKHKFDDLINKDDFKNTFSKRYADYLYILSHDNYNFSNNFFNDVYEYQTAQITSIKNNNQFSTFNPEGNCLENTKEELKIKSIISDNFSLIDAFMAQQ